MALLSALLAASFAVSAAADKPPRVIIFALGDDFGFNNVGFPHGPLSQGNPEVRTPTLDRLAMEGVRLERHYVYKVCSPTRSAFLSGRLPVHVNQVNPNKVTDGYGADLRMTLLPEKLRQASYYCAMTGKWHVGARSAANLPVNRGFDYHFGFLKGGEDHFEQNNCAGGPDTQRVDLWENLGPARGKNGTYSAHLYAEAALGVINNFSASLREGSGDRDKLFLYLPWHDTHAPLQAPEEYFFPSLPQFNNSFKARITFNAMARAMDEGMKNVTDALVAEGLWSETLLVFSADNGAWGSVHGGSNYPLRGGKVTDFEGGVRVVAFVSGGYLPQGLRGSRHHGFISVADWYATFLGLAGVDPSDSRADGVPAIDSLDQWPALLVPNATWDASTNPRMEIHLSTSGVDPNHAHDEALIKGRYKILCGPGENLGFWQGPVFPNSSRHDSDPGCGSYPDCCLFDIISDETEHRDLRLALPDVYADMVAALAEAAKTQYQTNYTDPLAMHCISDAEAKAYYGNFVGPECFAEPPVVGKIEYV